MADDASRKRRKGTIGGLLMIAFGLISAIVVYIQDSTSFDFFRMMHAWDFAVLHAVLWGVAGLIVIAWYNRPPPEYSSRFERRDPNDPTIR